MISAAYNITNQRDAVNALNVFPVPDGDTGTNMSMTITSARKELERLPDDVTVDKVAKTTSSAMLRGARGNSGVILSLIFRGIAKGLKGKEEIDARDMILALSYGVESAYKAVMTPTEGTILTVDRNDRVAKYLVEDGGKILFVGDVLPDLVDGDFLEEGGEIEIIVVLHVVGAEPEAGAVEGGQMLEPTAQEAALDPVEARLVQAVLRQESGLVEDAIPDLLGVDGVAAAGQDGGPGAEFLAAAEAGIDEAVLVEPLVELAGLAEEHLRGDARHQLLVGHVLPLGGRGALEGQLEGGHSHIHLPAGQGDQRRFRLRLTEVGDGDAAALPGQHFLGDGGHLVGIHIAHHAEHHVRRVVEGPVAVVEGLGGDLLDGFHGARNGDPDGMVVIESLVHLLHDHGIGGVGVHQDLLGDDAPLLLHTFFGKIGGGDEFQQQPESRLKILGAGEIIGGNK